MLFKTGQQVRDPLTGNDLLLRNANIYLVMIKKIFDDMTSVTSLASCEQC